MKYKIDWTTAGLWQIFIDNILYMETKEIEINTPCFLPFGKHGWLLTSGVLTGDLEKVTIK